jgi:lipopolysaccharide transport system permease protein
MASIPRRDLPAEPVEIIRPLTDRWWPDLRELWRFRGFFFILVWRDLKVRYKQTALGGLWILLQPMLQMLVFSIVLGAWAKIPTGQLPYAVFVLSGLVAFNLVIRCMAESPGVIRGNQNLTTKVFFPRIMLPAAITVSAAVDLCVALIVLLAIAAVLGVHPGATVLLLPLAILVIMLAGFGFAVWLAALGLRYRDVGFAMPAISQAMFYASPVVYPLTLVPERWHALYRLNPFTGMLELFRWTAIDTGSPALWAVVWTIAAFALLAITGIVYFVRTERSFNDHL